MGQTTWTYRRTDTTRPCLACQRVLPIASFPWSLRKGTYYRRRTCWLCLGLAIPPLATPWAYRASDTQRRCRECERLLPIDKFGMRKIRRQDETRLYRQRVCQFCIAKRAQPPTRRPRQNDRGEWRCGNTKGTTGCGRYLHRDAFGKDAGRSTPAVYCRECVAARVRQYYRRKAVNDEWVEEKLDRQRQARHAAAKRRLEGRTDVARSALSWLLAHGWKRSHIRHKLNISHKTIQKIERGELLRWRRASDRLVELQQAEFIRLHPRELEEAA